MSKTLALFALLGLALAPAAYAQKTVAGQSFPASVKVGENTLVLNGVGLRKATFLKIKAYAAGLYLPEKSSDAKAILGANKPWQITLKMLRNTSAESMSEGLTEAFKKNGNAALKKQITQFTSYLKDLKENDVVTIMFEPGKGTSVKQGSTDGLVKGDVFGKAVLMIWIGNPPNPDIKTGMLGK